jgi:EPS-associated MarR family transcriptional regulator
MATDKVDLQREDVHFRVLRLLDNRPDASQREISEELGVSLGAVNYCLKALIEKGHVKLANFRASRNKLGYVYMLTPLGLALRAELAMRFVERKRCEYEALRRELDDLAAEFPGRPEEGRTAGEVPPLALSEAGP